MIQEMRNAEYKTINFDDISVDRDTLKSIMCRHTTAIICDCSMAQALKIPEEDSGSS